jgi:uncharacterized membrane protein YjjP (DUF1212 family)
MENQAQSNNWVITSFKEAAWAPLCVVGIYVFGLAFHLYKSYPWIDIPTHFLGGVTITYFYRTAIRNSQRIAGAIPLPIQILFAFTATGTTTVFWEFYENLADHFLHTHMVRGLEDTITDLFLGVMGALVLSLFYRR